jgi:hypothetical protein
MKRKLAFGSRPKKTGARKNYRMKVHKKRLVAAGIEEASLKKLNPAEIRQLLRKVAKKKAPKAARAASTVRKAAKAAGKSK